MRLRRTGSLRAAVLLASVVVGAIGLSASAAPPAPRTVTDAARDATLAAELLRAVDERDYAGVIDRTPPSGGPGRIHQTPNVDVAVIELDPSGRPRAAANVLLSPRYPDGVAVPLNGTLSTREVRWRWWDDTEWDANGGQGTRDVLPDRVDAPVDFTSPYPASVLKLMVGFGVLRLVDRGVTSLDEEYAYQPTTVSPACGQATRKPVRQYFDEMITVSSNGATCALIKMLHDLDGMDQLNATFAALGLDTLKLTGTDPGNGGGWLGANMSALDTAKLLLIIDGGPGVLWSAPDGRPVTADVLSPAARDFFLATLGEQGHNEMLSTTNWCGRDYPAPGIPQLTPARWVDPADGTMTVAGTVYGQDVRPCDAAAEVTFAHKTGWVDTTGSDAGIVHALPGRPARDYIVVVISNVGTDYVDAHRPPDPPGVYPVPYTERHAQLGAAIDAIMKARRAGS